MYIELRVFWDGVRNIIEKVYEVKMMQIAGVIVSLWWLILMVCV